MFKVKNFTYTCSHILPWFLHFFAEFVHPYFVPYIFPYHTEKIMHFPVKCPVILCPDKLLPDYTEKIAHFRWKCPLKKCAPHFYRRWYHKTTSIYGKMSTSILFATSFLQIIPINYLILCKNVHDFYVRTISSDYTWKLSHFKQKCLHLFCRLHFSSVYLKYCTFLGKM